MLPAIVVVSDDVDMDERSPLGPFGFSPQTHSRFERSPVCFPSVTADAGTNDVFPSSGSTPIARGDVVEIEVTPVENFRAILAGIVIPLKNIVACEFDFFFWNAIEQN